VTAILRLSLRVLAIPVLIATLALAAASPAANAAQPAPAKATSKTSTETVRAHSKTARKVAAARRAAKRRLSLRRRSLNRCRARATRAALRSKKRNGGRLTRRARRQLIARRKNCLRRYRAAVARDRRRQGRGTSTNTGPNAGTNSGLPRSADGLRIGVTVNSQHGSDDIGWEQDLATEVGAGWIREEFSWERIEPSNDQWNFSRYDDVVEEAAKRRLTVLPLLMNTPDWAGATWHTVPNDPAEYAEYVGKVTGRYGPGGDFWREHPELPQVAPTHFEIYNETYLEVFTNNDVNPGRYARLVKAAAIAGRAANPNAKFLIQADTFYTYAPGDYRQYIDDMYAAVPDLNKYFDGAAVHPYSSGLSPAHYTAGGNTRWQFGRLAEIRERLAAHGGTDKPLWLTEIGWSTCPADDDCVSEDRHADYVRTMFELLRGKYSDYVAGVFLYHMHDWGPRVADDKEYWFGLTRPDGSKKPAWHALRAAAR
jgi:hypothetical protein